MHLYRSYVFKDKDPAIDKIRTIVQDEGVSEAQLHVLSNVSLTTFAAWFRGDTKRPQHATLAAAASALGYDWTLQKKKALNYDDEMVKATRWHEQQKAKKE